MNGRRQVAATLAAFAAFDRRRAWAGPAVAALFALLAALSFLALLPPAAAGNDSADYTDFYLPVAQSLLAGQGLMHEGAVAARYPPGFPAVIAAAIGGGGLFGVSAETAVRWLGLFGFAATAACLYRLGRRIHSPLAGLLAAAAFALYPPHLFLVKQPNSELIFLPLLLFGLELLWFARSGEEAELELGAPRSERATRRFFLLALAAGAVFGLAALVRPIVLLLFVPLGVFLVCFGRRSRRVLPALALAAGQLLVMAPWVIHLHRELDRWVPLSTGGRLSMLDGLTVGAKKDREGPPLPARVVALMREIDAERPRLRSPGAIFAFLGDKAVAEPLSVGQLLLVKVGRSFYGTDSLRYENFLLALQLPLLLAAAAAWAVAWRRRGGWRPLAALTLLVLLYFLAMTVLVLSVLRYMVPALALVFLLLAALTAEFLAPPRPAG